MHCFFLFSLFTRQPTAAAAFSAVGGGDFTLAVFKAQMSRVSSGIDLCINSLSDRGLNEEILSHLQEQHANRAGVSAGAFQVSHTLHTRPRGNAHLHRSCTTVPSEHGVGVVGARQLSLADPTYIYGYVASNCAVSTNRSPTIESTMPNHT